MASPAVRVRAAWNRSEPLDPLRAHVAVTVVVMLLLGTLHAALVLSGVIERGNEMIALGALVAANLAGWTAGAVARRRSTG